MLSTVPARRSCVLLALVALAASGCGQGEGGSGGSGGGGNMSKECPKGANPGEACDTPGDSCDDAYDECGGTDRLTCNDQHQWVEVPAPRCCSAGDDTLPYPDCPASLPTPGLACEVCIGAPPCEYTVDNGCGDQQAQAECDAETSSWAVETPQCGE